MTAIIIVAACTWALVKLLRSINAKQTEREQQRIREEQARLRTEVMKQARRQAEQERAIAKAAKEREALRKEQERQAKELAKHEDMIARMTEQMRKADADIDFLTTRIADLDYQLDFQLMTQAALLPGSKGFEKCQGKIVTLRNQIHTAESRLANAEYKREQAQRKLA